MNSVYGKILLWSAGVVLLGFLALVGVGMLDNARNGEHGPGPGNLDALFLAQTLDAYRTGGTERLQAELKRIGTYMRGQHYLIDDTGRDLLTGKDLSYLMTRDSIRPG